jgi:hypothetical protein
MVSNITFSLRRSWIAVLCCGVAGFGCGLAAAQTSEPKCVQVAGFYEERAVTAECTSPVALCTAYHYRGALEADNFFTASSIVDTADTPITGVVFATGDSALTDVRVAGRRGTLAIKNAAVFHTTGDGELLDVQTIVGGGGELAGATGVIKTIGNFVDGAGQSDFEGVVCLP